MKIILIFMALPLCIALGEDRPEAKAVDPITPSMRLSLARAQRDSITVEYGYIMAKQQVAKNTNAILTLMRDACEKAHMGFEEAATAKDSYGCVAAKANIADDDDKKKEAEKK